MSGHLGGTFNSFGMLASGNLRSASLSSATLGSQSDLDIWVPQELRPAHSSLPHVGFSARNEDWNIVQKTIIKVFQREKLSPSLFHLVKDKIRNLRKSEIGPFIYDYYKNQLVSKGTQILRESLRRGSDEELDELLGETWDRFYMDILPTLEYILQEISVKDLGVKEVTLLGFRDNLLLKLQLEGALVLAKDVSPQIRQMLLVLQSVRESSPPSENYLRLENLVAQVVNPYLGFNGLYMGSDKPVVISNRHTCGHYKKKTQGKRLEPFSVGACGSLGRSTMSPKRQASSPGITGLPTVAEVTHQQFLQIDDSDYPRRHSATLLY